MDYHFSDRIVNVKPSAIREIFKVLGDPSIISLAGGNPSPDTFPAEEMGRLAASLLQDEPATALQYGITEGYPRLRELTAKRLHDKFNIGRDFDDCIIVTGGQQGIDLTTKVLTNEGDVVLCEDPSFIGALNAFRTYNTKLVGIPLESDGMNLEKLEQAMKDHPNARFLYIISTFQNPAGISTSLEKRKAILALAEKYNVMILEDNPYLELRYSGEYIPPLKSLDEKGQVIYCGSYSKVICPGIRLGFIVGPSPIVSKMIVAKQVQDVHSNQLGMLIVTRYLETADFDEHIQRSIQLYRQKRDCMLQALNEYCSDALRWNVPDGGLFLWAELQKNVDSMPLVRQLSANKVAVVPGSAFLPDETKTSNAIRLNFSMPSMEQIEKAVQIIGKTSKEIMKG